MFDIFLLGELCNVQIELDLLAIKLLQLHRLILVIGFIQDSQRPEVARFCLSVLRSNSDRAR